MKKLFILFLLFIVSACASGSAIVTGNIRPAVAPESVKLFMNQPLRYEVIGLVEASSDSGWTAQGSQGYAIAELKKQAAKLGANGVLLTATGDQTSMMFGGYGTGMIWAMPINAKTIKGTAIFVHGD